MFGNYSERQHATKAIQSRAVSKRIILLVIDFGDGIPKRLPQALAEKLSRNRSEALMGNLTKPRYRSPRLTTLIAVHRPHPNGFTNSHSLPPRINCPAFWRSGGVTVDAFTMINTTASDVPWTSEQIWQPMSQLDHSHRFCHVRVLSG